MSYGGNYAGGVTTGVMATGTDPTQVLGRRIIAYLLDSLATYIVFAVILYFIDPGVTWSFTPVGLLPAGVLIVAFVSWWILTHVVMEGVWGFTPGKLAMGIRVARWDGRPPGPGWAALRNVLWIFDGLLNGLVGLFVLLVTKNSQRLGDLAAGTFVIDAAYSGRLLVRTPEGLRAGPASLHASELGLDKGQAAALRTPNKPVLDGQRGTYIVWRTGEQLFYVLDPATKVWHVLPAQPS